MARFKPHRLIEKMTGKLSGKSRFITRQKHYHTANADGYGDGPHEIYRKRKRDYTQKPMTEGERLQREKWAAACREASAITHDSNHPRYVEFQERWQRLQHGEADAVVGQKEYAQFGNFVRAVLLRE